VLLRHARRVAPRSTKPSSHRRFVWLHGCRVRRPGQICSGGGPLGANFSLL
jgi:hypothetical protein